MLEVKDKKFIRIVREQSPNSSEEEDSLLLIILTDYLVEYSQLKFKYLWFMLDYTLFYIFLLYNYYEACLS
jgi:hypothetical protein